VAGVGFPNARPGNVHVEAGDPLVSVALETSSESAEPHRVPSVDVDRFFDLSLDFMCIVDAHGAFVRVSASSTRLLGYTRDELTGRRFLDFVHPEDVQRTAQQYQSVVGGSAVLEFENR
jgi:PAS domain-containing protein